MGPGQPYQYNGQPTAGHLGGYPPPGHPQQARGAGPKKRSELTIGLMVLIVINLGLLFIGLLGALAALGYGITSAGVDLFFCGLLIVIGAISLMHLNSNSPFSLLSSGAFGFILVLYYIIGLIVAANTLASVPSEGFFNELAREELTFALFINVGLLIFGIVTFVVVLIKHHKEGLIGGGTGAVEEHIDEGAANRPKKRCIACGAEVGSDALFCPICGERWG